MRGKYTNNFVLAAILRSLHAVARPPCALSGVGQAWDIRPPLVTDGTAGLGGVLTISEQFELKSAVNGKIARLAAKRRHRR